MSVIIGILYTREDANKEGVKWTIVALLNASFPSHLRMHDELI